MNYYAQAELKHIYSLVKRVAAGKKNESFIITNKVPYVIKEHLQRNVIERKKRTIDNSFAFFISTKRICQCIFLSNAFQVSANDIIQALSKIVNI